LQILINGDNINKSANQFNYFYFCQNKTGSHRNILKKRNEIIALTQIQLIMKTLKKFWHFAFVLFGIMIMLFGGCKKDDNNNNGQENVPVLSTKVVTEIRQTTAISGGNITDDKGKTVTERGVCWSTAVTPTINDNKTINAAGAGSFNSKLTALEPNTTYFVRSYATNNNGTGYGMALSFSTPDKLYTSGAGVIDIEGNKYNTVIIGNQEWMSENLRTTKHNDGTIIPTGYSANEWKNLRVPAYTIYPYAEIEGINSEAEVVEIYGALYNWYAVETGKLCPSGWRVPSDGEWRALSDYIAEQGYYNEDIAFGAGNALKSCRQIDSPLGGDCNTTEQPYWESDNTHHGLDKLFGFLALPGGSRYSSFYSIGSRGYWWTSTESHTSPWFRFVSSNKGNIDRRFTADKFRGFSIRCIKD
jgi:uncharacterized protein (TIGR02145 family)